MRKILISIIFCLVVGNNAYAKDKVKWNELRSPHFIIYYHDAPKNFIMNVKEAAEDYYTKISSNLGFVRIKSWTFNNRVKIYVYDTQEDYVEEATQMGWSQAHAQVRKKKIVSFITDSGFFDTTLPHEITHITFRENVGYRSFIPLWFEEGVAMHQEKAGRWGAHRTVKQALKRGAFLPLSDLTRTSLFRNASRDMIELFYAESASVVNFLMSEFGRHRFIRFCRRLKKGETFERALRATYIRFKSIDDLNKSWVNYLEK